MVEYNCDVKSRKHVEDWLRNMFKSIYASQKLPWNSNVRCFPKGELLAGKPKSL